MQRAAAFRRQQMVRRAAMGMERRCRVGNTAARAHLGTGPQRSELEQVAGLSAHPHDSRRCFVDITHTWLMMIVSNDVRYAMNHGLAQKPSEIPTHHGLSGTCSADAWLPVLQNWQALD